MENIVGSYGLSIQKENKIREKGKSKLFFPQDYTLVDLETTGYDPKWDHIIEIGALRVRNGEIVDKTSHLIKYGTDNTIPSAVENITGITEDMIEKDGIDVRLAIKNLLSFIGDDLVVGFNVNFDINFIYDYVNEYFQKKFENDYVDVLRIARRFYPNERHNRLKDCIERINLDKKQSHRGLEDCYDTKKVLDFFKNNSDPNFMESMKKHYHHSKIDLKLLKPETEKFDSGNPFYKSNVCFTGKLDTLLRKQAAQLVVNLGGIAQNGVTEKTDYLILGDTAYSLHNKGTLTTKMKRAYDLINNGNDLKVINESVFIDMLDDRKREINGNDDRVCEY